MHNNNSEMTTIKEADALVIDQGSLAYATFMEKAMELRPFAESRLYYAAAASESSEESEASNSTIAETDSKIEDNKEIIEKKARLLENRAVRIAVIGAGIGGASACHFMNESLTQLLINERDQPFTIDLYERNHYIGGRVQTGNIDFDEKQSPFVIEHGAWIMINENKYMYDFTDMVCFLYAIF